MPPLELNSPFESAALAAFDPHSLRCLDGRITRVGEYPAACGGHADVWRGLFENRGVAVKVTRPWSSSLDDKRKHRAKLLKRLWREYLAWSSLSHPNVLELLGFSYDFSPDEFSFPSFISPWMSNGTVDSYIEKHHIARRFKLLVGIAEGLLYLHTRQPAIIHGDLRAGNVLVSDSGTPCLSDFGLSRVLNETKQTPTSSNPAGSLRWMSPELLRDEGGVTMQSDVWAFGMTVLEVLTGERPYSTWKNDAHVFGHIIDGDPPPRPDYSDSDDPYPDLFDDDSKLWRMCRRCWSVQPTQRPSMSRIISVLREYDDGDESEVSSEAPEQPAGGHAAPFPYTLAALPTPLESEDSNRSTPDDTNTGKSTRNILQNTQQHDPPNSTPAMSNSPGPQRPRVNLTGGGNFQALWSLAEIPELKRSVKTLFECYDALEHIEVLKNQCKELLTRCIELLLDLRNDISNNSAQIVVQEAETITVNILNLFKTWSSWGDDGSHEYEMKAGLKMSNEEISRKSDYLKTHAYQRRETPTALVLGFRIVSRADTSGVTRPSIVDLTSEVRRLSDDPVSSNDLGDVYLGKMLGTRVSLKIIRGINISRPAQVYFMEAVEWWRKLKHQNVETLYGSARLDNHMYAAVSPWTEHRDALTYIKNNPHADRLKILTEAATGLEYLHRNLVVHGDLRAARILISEAEVAYITDFGVQELIKNVDPPPRPDAEVIRWMAPEVIAASEIISRWHPFHRHPPSDIWSYGMTCHEIFTGQRPFHDKLLVTAVRSDILQGIRPTRPSTEATQQGLSDSLWALMQRCWELNKELRPSISYIVKSMNELWNIHGRVFQSAATPSSPPGSLSNYDGGTISRPSFNIVEAKEIMRRALSPKLFDEDCLDDRTIATFARWHKGINGYYAHIQPAYMGHIVTIKTINTGPLSSQQTGDLDRRILKWLCRKYLASSWVSHPNILPYLGFTFNFTPKSSIFPSLIFPWMSNGTLLSFLKEHPDADRYELASGIARGLAHLHAQEPPIIHGDVRMENILVSDSCVPCLSTFRLSEIFRREGVQSWADMFNSLRWMSPELLRRDRVPNRSSDVWAFGMTVLEMISGNHPYEGITGHANVFRQIRGGKIPERLESITSENDALWKICLRCWVVDPKQRPNMQMIRKKIRAHRRSIEGR